MTLYHPALTTAPPTLVFVANATELLHVSATSTTPQLWAGEYVTLYDVTDPQVLATYRVQRIQHRIPTHGDLPPDATFPLAPWEIVVHLIPESQVIADALNRRQRLARLRTAPAPASGGSDATA
jgi:hypothetical protein